MAQDEDALNNKTKYTYDLAHTHTQITNNGKNTYRFFFLNDIVMHTVR